MKLSRFGFIALVASTLAATQSFAKGFGADWEMRDLKTAVRAAPFGFDAKSDTRELMTTIETDANPGTTKLMVIRDGALLKGVYYEGHDGRTVTLSLEQMRQGPQVLKQSSGRDVILMSVERDFTAEKGGHANVRFLRNGISGTYKNFRVFLDIQGGKVVLRSDPNPRDPESDNNAYTSVFNYLYMKKNTVLGKTVGVEFVQPAMR